ncbi:PREDICTED: UBX domain-containing protein 2B [Charadrius vociferus]|nr:PREDICTED: UBX domain-containing protein 2B [Charadrius vociferus]
MVLHSSAKSRACKSQLRNSRCGHWVDITECGLPLSTKAQAGKGRTPLTEDWERWVVRVCGGQLSKELEGLSRPSGSWALTVLGVILARLYFLIVLLALAELYEDEAKRQSLCPDKPTTPKTSNTKVSQSLKIDSLRRLRKPERSMSDDKENQRFYSGDSEYRELQISGASNNPSKIVAELFKEAKEHGAVPLDEASRASGDFSKAKSFSGGGYRLGDSSQKHSEYIYGENQDVQILLKLWRNGFSLDDGELRSYSDPTNAQFLESVKRGEIPVELQRIVHGGQVNLDMEDHQEQEYVKPRLRFKAFSGEGQKLGSLTPEIVSTPSSPEEEEKSILNAPVLIDDSMPATKIQIRLADGSRLIQRFNQTHRIKDIRDFIIQSRPAFATTDFVLVTTFPNKELTDENLTLQEADILNTVILQQLK